MPPFSPVPIAVRSQLKPFRIGLPYGVAFAKAYGFSKRLEGNNYWYMKGGCDHGSGTRAHP